MGLPTLAAWMWLAAAPADPGRFAVVVGANGAAPGRELLRFAHRDAEDMAEVLARTGQFRRDRIRTLLDPDPEALLAALDATLAPLAAAPGETLLLFFDSGHADAAALYPNGKPLPFARLRGRLESASATVRLGIVDACRGGGWTLAKGMTADAPFEVKPAGLSSEGSVLLASSSGMENAHESDVLAGSLFTHHLVAALRGAADRNGDGEVTLSEAFGYAKEFTLRDSSLQADAPQHPSFQMNLHGRRDVPLAWVDASDTRVELRQEDGPLQLIQLATGFTVVELPRGKRQVRVALTPGRYLVRSRRLEGIRAREIAVEASRSMVVAEESLELIGATELASKDGSRPPAALGQESRFAAQVILGIPLGTRLQYFPYAERRWRFAVEGFVGNRRSFDYLRPSQSAWLGAGARVAWVGSEDDRNALLVAPGLDAYYTWGYAQYASVPGSAEVVQVGAAQKLFALGVDLDITWYHQFSPRLASELGLKVGYLRKLNLPDAAVSERDQPITAAFLGLRF